MLSEAQWRDIYNLFNPAEKLAGERLAFFIERDGSQTKKIARTLNFSKNDEKLLFVGQRGSGKSTELRYLVSLLNDDFFNVILDIEELTNIFTVNHVELLYVMGIGAFAATKAQGYDLDEKYIKDLAACLETLVKEQTENQDYKLDISGILATLGSAASAAAGSITGASFIAVANMFKNMKMGLGLNSKAIRKLEVKPQISHTIAALDRLLKAVQDITQKKPFLIIDGLDRIEFTQARLIFAESHILTTPQCALAYVVPAHLFHSSYMSMARQQFNSDIQLPNIKLKDRHSRERYQPGYDMLIEVVNKRLQSVQLTVEDVFEPEALDLLIEKSGGLMREFIKLVQDTVVQASLSDQPRANREHAQEIVDDLRRKYMAALNKANLQELVSLYNTGILTGDDISNELLQNLYILTQSNRDLWYEVHPIIADIVEDYAKQA